MPVFKLGSVTSMVATPPETKASFRAFTGTVVEVITAPFRSNSTVAPSSAFREATLKWTDTVGVLLLVVTLAAPSIETPVTAVLSKT